MNADSVVQEGLVRESVGETACRSRRSKCSASVTGEATRVGTAKTTYVPAPETTNVAAAESAAGVATAETTGMTAPAAVTSAAMLRPDGHCKE